MTQKELTTKKDYAAIGGEISHEKANDWIKAYENTRPEGPTGYMLGRCIIEKILAQPGCTGIRFHYALNDAGQKTLVYIGMDADGKDLLQLSMVTETGAIVNEAAITADWITIVWPWW
jgi:hypothetical protein